MTRSATPARAKGAARRIVSDAGTMRCVELMTSGQWVSGRSHIEVADAFSVSPETVKEWATSASRIIRLCLGDDREAIRARMVSTLEEVQRQALGGKKPDLKAAVAAVSANAQLLGLVEQRHKVEVKAETYAGLDDGALLERVETQIAELQELRQRLLSKGAVLALPGKDDDHG